MKNSGSKRVRVLLAAVLSVCICVIAGLWLLTDPGDKNAPSEALDVNATARTPDEKPLNTGKLIGRWLRLDSRYIIEIRKINDDGTLDAAYYNPKPINIAQAKVSQEEAAMKVFIELRDRGYPGSVYTLYYRSDRDMLGGTYFHAGTKQHFQVFFVRKKQ